MKSTGIVRRMDNLGRVVIPKELRKTHEINAETPLEIFVEDNGAIILRKYITRCVLCGDEHEKSELTQYKAALICGNCYSVLI